MAAPWNNFPKDIALAHSVNLLNKKLDMYLNKECRSTFTRKELQKVWFYLKINIMTIRKDTLTNFLLFLISHKQLHKSTLSIKEEILSIFT